MRRKVLAIAICTVSAMTIAYWQGLAAALFAPAIYIFCYKIAFKNDCRQKNISLCLTVAFVAGALAMTAASFDAQNQGAEYLADEPIKLSGKVKEIEKAGDESYRLSMDVDGVTVLCSFYQKIENWYRLTGCTLEFTATVERPKPSGNPRTFDYSLYLKTKKIYLSGTMERCSISKEPQAASDRLKRLLVSKREVFMENLEVSDEGKAMIRGVLFGDTGELDEETYKAFQRNGTAHVLAVSGLHVGVLYSLYRKLVGKRRSLLPALILIFLLLLYGGATLWPPSVRRAVCLVVLSEVGRLLERRYDMTTALAGAVIVEALVNPMVILGAGFQMSYLAAASLSFFSPIAEKKLPQGIAVVVSVQVGLMPYMAYNFNYISIGAFFCNFPVVFLISLLVPVGIAGFFAFFFLGSTFGIVSACLGGLAEMTKLINGIFPEKLMAIDVVSPPLWVVFALYFLMFYLASEHFRIYAGRKDFPMVLLPGLLALVICTFGWFAWASPFDKAEVVFVDVGQGDCVHIKSEAGSILIDGGGNIRYNIGEKTLKPYLLKNGFGDVDLALATHLHTDHYLGLEQLAECFDVNAFLTKGKAGQRIGLSKDSWIDILWPLEENPDTDDENYNSLIFMANIKGVKVLITGDITEEGELALLKKYKGTDLLKCDVLKIAHHGSKYSTSDEFLQAANPSIAVIGVGKNNYGHPSQMVIEKLQKKGIMVFRTDLDGAVGIINEKGKLSICTQRQASTALRFSQKT